MHCPVDNETLMMTERNGIEIDYCPKCRGVWLDRGELDKIIERAAGAAPGPAILPAQPFPPQPVPQPGRTPDTMGGYAAQPRDRYRDHDDDDDRYHHGKKKKREGFLGELFDF